MKRVCNCDTIMKCDVCYWRAKYIKYEKYTIEDIDRALETLLERSDAYEQRTGC